MRIALPHEYGYVNQHFGRSREFAIVELVDGKMVSKKIVSAEQLQHNHGGLAGLLKDEQVDTVIVGGIGAGALQPLKETGMQVIAGINGKIEEVVMKYAQGQLPSGLVVCCNDHGDNCSH